MKRLCQMLCLILALVLLWGCGTSNQPPQTQPSETQPSQTQPPETTQEPVAQTRLITDMAGRELEIPMHIEKVFSTGHVAAIYLYTLTPERLLGWNYELNDLEKSIILEEYHDLPNFGQNDAVNFEAVIAASPDIALNVGTMGDALIDECEDLTAKLGIPVVAVDGDLLQCDAAYTFLGELLGVQEDAAKLADYAKRTFEDLEHMTIDQPVRVYYGNGEDSLETAPKGSSHGQLLDLVKAENVADLELSDGARVQISAEQLLAWDPDVIVVNGEPKSDVPGDSAAKALMENPIFETLTAVQEGKVYGIPNAPFSWVDRPPASNRLIGIRWLSSILYPDALGVDVDEEVKEFFRLFYHVELTDEALQNIYEGNLG